jgi:hypothetical protein
MITDKILDRHDLTQAAESIHKEIKMPIRFAFDTVGSESSAWCQNVLAARTGVQYRPSLSASGANDITLGPSSSLTHLVCLTGIPTEKNPNIRIHQVPIKLFHANAAIGQAISRWLELLLADKIIKLPETMFEFGGLEAVKAGLERLKRGELSGKRLVIKMAE